MTTYASPDPDVAVPRTDVPLRPRPRRRARRQAGADRRAERPGADLRASSPRRSRPWPSGLASRGFGKGDVLAIYMPEPPEYAVAFHGAAAAGGMSRPSIRSTRPTSSPTSSRTRARSCSSRSPPFLEARARGGGPAGRAEVFVFGEAEGATPFAALLATRPAAGARDRPAGRPRRAALLERHDRAAQGRDAHPPQPRRQPLPAAGRAPDRRRRHAASASCRSSTSTGMTVIMNLALRAGATIVTMPRFDLEQFLDLLAGACGDATLRRPADRPRPGQAPAGRRVRPLGAAHDHARGAAPLGGRAAEAAARAPRLQRDPGLRPDRDQSGDPRDPRRPSEIKPGSIGQPLPTPNAGSSTRTPARTSAPASAASSGSADRR